MQLDGKEMWEEVRGVTESRTDDSESKDHFLLLLHSCRFPIHCQASRIFYEKGVSIKGTKKQNTFFHCSSIPVPNHIAHFMPTDPP